MKSRIYITGYGKEIRLVRANNRMQALSHIAESIINVSAASKDDLVKYITQGLKIEDAAGFQQEEIK
jgi:hypothetical protein